MALPEDGMLTLQLVTLSSPDILAALRKAAVKAFSEDGGDRRGKMGGMLLKNDNGLSESLTLLNIKLVVDGFAPAELTRD